jgi:hypothetical protein
MVYFIYMYIYIYIYIHSIINLFEDSKPAANYISLPRRAVHEKSVPKLFTIVFLYSV